MVRIDGMNDMRRPLYVTRKPNGEYRYQRQLDDKTRELYGKRFYIHSFKTNKLNEVLKAYPTVHTDCEDLIAQYEQSTYDIPKDIRVTLLTELKQRFILLPAPDKATLPDLLDAKVKLKQNLLKLNLRMHDTGEDCEVFDPLIKGFASAKETANTYKDLLLRIENAYRRITGEETIEHAAYVDALTEELAGFDFSYTSTANVSAPPETHSYSAEATTHLNSPKLSEALESWRQEGNYKGKTLADKRYAVKRFIELCGDLPITNIKREHCRKYRDMLAEFPIIKSHKVRGLPLDQIQALIQKGELNTSDKLAPRTINKMIDGVRSVIQIAIDEHDLPIKNPASGFQVKKRNKYTRLGFSNEELQTLFDSPIYTGCLSEKKRHIRGKMLIRDEYYWLPLLGLYTGARLEELAQLHVHDISEENNIPVFRLTENGDEKRVKTEDSQRTVPIHHEIIKCGFLDFVTQAREAGHKRIFQNLDRNNYEDRYGKEVSKRFNSYLSEIGIKPDRAETGVLKDFHSFRHCFKTACRKADIDKPMHNRLTGHKSALDVSDGYGEYPIETLNKWMQKVKHPIDLRHLHLNIKNLHEIMRF